MNTSKTIKVFAPATVANVGCGFDILGFAVEAPGDELAANLTDSGTVILKNISGTDKLPLDSKKNCASVAAQALLDQLKTQNRIAKTVGLELELFKKMPLGSGLGSSAASSAAAVFAANALFGQPFTRAELVPFAMQGEQIACGSAHADNVAPALLGGFVLIRSYEPLDIISLPCPAELYCTLIHPQLEVRTEDARKILKKSIPLSLAIKQWGNVAGLVAALTTNNIDLLGRSLEDLIIEPERSLLIPGFANIKSAALFAGALGCSISGSGPALFALCKNKNDALKIAAAMTQELTNLSITSQSYISKINLQGCKIL